MSDWSASLRCEGTTHRIFPGDTAVVGGLMASFAVRTVEEGAYLTLSLTNAGAENTSVIDDPCTLDIDLVTGGEVRYHTLHGDSCGAQSFLPKAFPLTAAYREEPTGGRSSDTTGFPFFDLDDGCGALAFAIGWTGQWYRALTPTENGIALRIGLSDAHFYLQPGETVSLPSVLIVPGSDAPAARRAMRKLLRTCFSPKAALGANFAMPIAIQCFDRYFQKLDGSDGSTRWASEAGQREMVDAAEKIGNIDTLWLDAAWFAEGFPHGVGNYRFAAGFPDGLKNVSDYAHAKGMRFVLWFEPERIFEGSDLFPQTDKLLSFSTCPDTRLYDLGNDDAYAWMEQTLQQMIAENGIDIYRQDFNFEPLEYWRENDAPDRRGIHEIKHVNGLYRLWDALLAKNPGLMIDNCASGGRRLDLGTMQRAVSLWRSDTGCWPENAEHRPCEWSTNQILTLGEYLPYHACAVWETDAYTVRSTATHGLACNFDVLNPNFDFAAAQRAVAEVKRLGHYWDGDFYPLTAPTPREDVWCAYQLSLGDTGVLYAFRRRDCAAERTAVKLSAIDESADYLLTVTDECYAQTQMRVSGSALADGLPLTIPQKRASLIVEYQKI